MLYASLFSSFHCSIGNGEYILGNGRGTSFRQSQSAPTNTVDELELPIMPFTYCRSTNLFSQLLFAKKQNSCQNYFPSNFFCSVRSISGLALMSGNCIARPNIAGKYFFSKHFANMFSIILQRNPCSINFLSKRILLLQISSILTKCLGDSGEQKGTVIANKTERTIRCIFFYSVWSDRKAVT